MSINRNSIIAAIGVIAIIAVAGVLVKFLPEGTPNPSASPAVKTIKKTGEIALADLAKISDCDFPANADKDNGGYDSFAKCLAQKEIKMYGADWCSHCKNQKEMFGSSFQYVNYIECAEGQYGQKQICKDNGIKSYPTWEFPEK
jgi:glutaredoxin